ncbi:MAG: aspartate aminotransferase family protein [Verrucomicrobiales bacterium]|nr:aspartate aminotransferase family protein [Verrucomicrobiales bacterium]
MTSRQTLGRLREFESPDVTFLDPGGAWPIVWERARNCTITDADGRRYTDLTAAFGVAAAGHANPAVVRAAKRQMDRLLHAMGDVHPHALKADLVRELSRLTFERWTARSSHPLRGRTVLTNSGFEAVEAALKTARLATGRRGVLAFRGAYHGLGYGTLNVTHRDLFRKPFQDQLGGFAEFLPWPEAGESRSEDTCPWETMEPLLRRALRRRSVGAILVEPMQARGGIRIPPAGFLPLLRKLADESGALLIVDEIYTGFGRTGRWFACEHSGVVPDLICLGKALTGGFPLSACVGRSDLMEAAWPPSKGEARHTSTFLGHPVGCAMALAQIRELRTRGLVQRSAVEGRWLLERLQALPRTLGSLRLESRGVGLMAGIELRHASGSPAGDLSLAAVQELLGRGYILLPEGAHGEVISLTPPLTISRRALDRCVRTLATVLGRLTA